jgi:hypothetical protein
MAQRLTSSYAIAEILRLDHGPNLQKVQVSLEMCPQMGKTL